MTSETTFEQLVNAYKNAVTVLEFPNDVQVEPQKLDQNLLEKSHGSLSTKENSEGEVSMMLGKSHNLVSLLHRE